MCVKMVSVSIVLQTVVVLGIDMMCNMVTCCINTQQCSRVPMHELQGNSELH